MAAPPKKTPPRPLARPAAKTPKPPMDTARAAAPTRPGAAKPGPMRPGRPSPEAAPPDDLANASPLGNLLLSLDRLCDILKSENDALTGNHIGDIQELQESKARLARIYAHYAGGLAKSPSEIEACSQSERDTLRKALQRLQELSDTNMRLLTVLMEANERLLHAMVEGLREQSRSVPTYFQNGSRDPGEQSLRPVAVYINEAL